MKIKRLGHGGRTLKIVIVISIILSMCLTGMVYAGTLGILSDGRKAEKIQELEPVIQPTGISEKDATEGAVVATLSMPEGYEGNVSYKLEDSDGLEKYQKYLEIDGNKVKISKEINKDAVPSDDYHMFKGDPTSAPRYFKEETPLYIKVSATDDEGHKSKIAASYNETDWKTSIIIKGNDVTEENDSDYFDVDRLQYYVGKKALTEVKDEDWKEIDGQELKYINSTTGKLGDEYVPVITVMTDSTVKELKNARVYIRPSFSKADVVKLTGDDLTGNPRNEGMDYIQYGPVGYRHGGMYDGFYRRFNLKLKAASNIKNIKPIIMPEAITENQAKGGTVLATLSMPDNYEGSKVHYELVDNTDDKIFRNIYSYIRVDGTKIKLIDNLNDGNVADYDILSKRSYDDGPRVKEDQPFHFQIVAVDEQGNRSKVACDYNEEDYSEPTVVIGKYAEIAEDNPNFFTVDTMKYYLGKKKLNEVNDDEWIRIESVKLSKLNDEDGTISAEPVIIESRTAYTTDEVKGMNLYLKYTADREGTALNEGENLMTRSVKDFGKNHVTFEKVSIYKGEYPKSFWRTFNLVIKTADSNINTLKPEIKWENLKGKKLTAGTMLGTFVMPAGYNGKEPEFKLVPDKDRKWFSDLLKIEGNKLYLASDMDAVLKLDYEDVEEVQNLIGNKDAESNLYLKSGAEIPFTVIAKYGDKNSASLDTVLNVPSAEDEAVIEEPEETQVEVTITPMEESKLMDRVEKMSGLDREIMDKALAGNKEIYDVTASRPFTGTLTFKIPVDTSKKLIGIYHLKKNNTVETFVFKDRDIIDGKVELSVTELSPFIIAYEADNNVPEEGGMENPGASVTEDVENPSHDNGNSGDNNVASKPENKPAEKEKNPANGTSAKGNMDPAQPETVKGSVTSGQSPATGDATDMNLMIGLMVIGIFAAMLGTMTVILKKSR